MNAKRLVCATCVWFRCSRSVFQRVRHVSLPPTTIRHTVGVVLKERESHKVHLWSQNHPLKLDLYHSFHTSPVSAAGHNKWSKIKKKKAVTDQQKSKLRGKLLVQIRTAVAIGGSDPTINIKLAGLLTQARSSGIPKSNLEAALAGSGSSGVARETVMYEGRGPSGYLLLVEALTDNRNRTRPEIRHIVEKQGGGVLGDTGSSAFMFDQKAVVELSTISPSSSEDPMELAIEVGAEDVDVLTDSEDEREVVQLKCEQSELSSVCDAVRERGLEVLSAGVVYVPRSTVSLTPEQFGKAEKLVDLLNEHTDVVAVYSNHEIAE